MVGMDTPTVWGYLSTVARAVFKGMLHRPGITATVFFVVLALMGFPIPLMVFVFVVGLYAYSAGRQKKDDESR